MKKLALLVLPALLAACGPSPTQSYAPPVQTYTQPAPVVVQQDSGMSAGTAAALGAGAGFIAGRMTAPQATPQYSAPAPAYTPAPRTTIINNVPAAPVKVAPPPVTFRPNMASTVRPPAPAPVARPAPAPTPSRSTTSSSSSSTTYRAKR